MFRTRTKLSSLEWEIMNIIWEVDSPVSVREVLERAYPNGEKAYTTVQTVMNKLVEKGFLSREKIGLVNFYHPIKDRTQTLQKEIKTFVNVTFGGSLPALANFLVDTDALSEADIKALRRLIDQKTAEGESDDPND